MTTERWTNGPGIVYAMHTHLYRKVLVVEKGTITFHLETRDVHLQPGNQIDLPAGTPHGATVGPDGVTCVETHDPLT